MKKLYHIVLPALCLLATTVAGAKVHDGGIKVSNATLTSPPAGGNLRLTMAIEVEENAVGTLHGIAVVPYMSDGNFEAEFPYALVNGYNRNNIFKRHRKFGYESLVANEPVAVMMVNKKNPGGTIDYEGEINHDAWMNDASLLVKFVLISPAGEIRYYTMGVSCVRVGQHGHAPHTPHTPPATVVVVEPTPQGVIVEIETEPVVEPASDEPEIHSFTGSAFLDFESGRSVLLPNYKRNSHELGVIKKAMDEVIDKQARNISIIVTGYASPEGRWPANDDLALHRAIALERYLQNHYGKLVSVSKVLTAGEDWDGLRKMVSESNIAHKLTVLQIIDSPEGPDAKESMLRRLAGGSVWATLTRDFFPELRRVDYDIMYEIEE